MTSWTVFAVQIRTSKLTFNKEFEKYSQWEKVHDTVLAKRSVTSTVL